MRARVLLLPMISYAALSSLALAANLVALDDPSLGGRNRYDRCLELVKRNPATALGLADGWTGGGGGAAALHCSALALVSLKRYADAAAKLDQAAHASGSNAMRAELLDQAGNAWLLAGQPGKADASFSGALAFVPQDEDVLSDRGRARGLRKDWRGAEADLSAVLSLDPDRLDALVLRASARHALGDSIDARKDVDHALDLDPGYPEALLERGTMKFESGDLAGARADWQQTLRAAPDSEAAHAAQTRMQALVAPAKPDAH
jgi:tetratricopeptide (TPR) repeat protein